jgi:LmbE family N-acetylglucosaminyl deacetylase/ActR/RegA family two-component response regulator
MTTADTPASRGRILLVEDDPQSASFVVKVLADRNGFEVMHTADPAVALRYAAEQSWDLVLTDVEMPGMTGIELLESLRQTDPNLPVAVVTAHATVDTAIRALRSRADDFQEKPLRPAQLVAMVSGLIAKGRAARLAGREVVLAIGAHPDDVEIGAAGTLVAHRKMGHDVAVLTLSRGARGGVESTRAGESERAARILGATLYLHDLEDTRISEGDPTIGIISRVIGELRPTVIYTHSVHDVHQDHRNTHRAVMVAAREVGRVYCFQSPSATVDFRPTRFVSIDANLDAKARAIDAFRSQMAVRAYLEPDLIEATARYWSRFAEGRYAEAFEVIRDRAAIAVGLTASQPELTPVPELAPVRRVPAVPSALARHVPAQSVSAAPSRRYP